MRTSIQISGNGRERATALRDFVHEMEKKRVYEQRIREVEHATFTPLVFSASGGFGKEATTFYKLLASSLAKNWDQPSSAYGGHGRLVVTLLNLVHHLVTAETDLESG